MGNWTGLCLLPRDPPRFIPSCPEMPGSFVNTPPGLVRTLTHGAPKQTPSPIRCGVHILGLTNTLRYWGLLSGLVTVGGGRGRSCLGQEIMMNGLGPSCGVLRVSRDPVSVCVRVCVFGGLSEVTATLEKPGLPHFG